MNTSPNSPLVLSIVSTEGGSGKSTTAVNIAWQAWNLKRLKVLLIDLDSNCSLNYFLGTKKHRSPEQTSWCLFQDDFTGELPLISVYESNSNICLLPGHKVVQPDLITTRISREKILKRTLPDSQAYSAFDLIILDNRGGIDPITHNAIAASTHLLIGSKVGVKSPDLAEAISDVSKVVRNLDLNPGPDLLGVFFSEMNQEKTYQVVMQGAKQGLGIYEGLTIYPEIPRSTYLAQASLRNLPLSKVRSSHPINSTYQQIVNDLVKAS